jgi:hypothetical protein
MEQGAGVLRRVATAAAADRARGASLQATVGAAVLVVGREQQNPGLTSGTLMLTKQHPRR